MTTQNRKPPTASIQVSTKRVGAERMPRVSSARDSADDGSVPTDIALRKVNAPSPGRPDQPTGKKRRQIMLCRLTDLNSHFPIARRPKRQTTPSLNIVYSSGSVKGCDECSEKLKDWAQPIPSNALTKKPIAGICRLKSASE